MDSIKQLLKRNPALGLTCLFALLSAVSLASAWHGPSFNYLGGLVSYAYVLKSDKSSSWRGVLYGILAYILLSTVKPQTNFGISIAMSFFYTGLIAFEIYREFNRDVLLVNDRGACENSRDRS
jgi:hypothetical protein